MSLAIFDLDNTLIADDSDYLWGTFLVEQHLVDGDYYRHQNERFYTDYKNGNMDVNHFLSFALEPLTRIPLPELTTLHQEFMQQKIAPIRLPKADALLDWHREKGDKLLIITSTNRFITAPIAQALGVEDILATEPEIQDDRYTGSITGTPCFQEGKVICLHAWLENHPYDLSGSYFYSDSINDVALLEAVEFPIAVDPDEQLRNYAQTRGWKIISLRA